LHVTRWIRQLVDARITPQIRVLEEVAREDLDTAERFWISQARGLGWPLTNLTKGGFGTYGWHHTADAKERIRRGNLKKIITDDTRAKLRALNLGKKHGPHSAETRAKISAANTGKKLGAKTIERIRLASLCKKRSLESIAKTAAGNRGRIQGKEERRARSEALRRHWAEHPYPAATPEVCAIRRRARLSYLAEHPEELRRVKSMWITALATKGG